MSARDIEVASARGHAGSTKAARRSRELEPRRPSSEATLRRALGNRTSGHLIQAKLTVGVPDDPYEREADRVADQVMRMPVAGDPPGSGHRSNRAPGHVAVSSIQRRCAGCEDERAGFVRRKCGACREEEERLQRKPARAGLSRMDRGQVPEEEEGLVQLKEGAPPTISPSSERQVTNPHGGQPLPSAVRSYFEPRFGYDFGHVRVHTGAGAAEAAQSIHALAYTTGHRIVFNQGQFSPESESGKRLLAHELTHVIQQNPSVGQKASTAADAMDRSPRTAPSTEIHGAEASGDRILVQRKPFFFAPPAKPSGTFVHNKVLPLFLDHNEDLFIEAPIPGANRKDPDKNAKGRADFYKAQPTGKFSRTIGIKFDDDKPAYMSGRFTEWSGGRYNHYGRAAPLGRPTSPRIARLDLAPVGISIGELKPGFSAEGVLGTGQIAHYAMGIENTAKAINAYVRANPGESRKKATWSPRPVKMTSLTIPPGLVYPGGTGFRVVPLALYEETFTGIRRVLEDTSLKGRLHVYADGASGVWSYEWMPRDIPGSTGSALVNTVLDRLNDNVIPAISSTTGGGVVSRKSMPRDRKSIPPEKKRVPPEKRVVQRAAPKRVVQRARKKFSKASWQRRSFGPWKKKAEEALSEEKEVGKATVARTLVDLEERSRKSLGIPAAVREGSRALGKIRHWMRFGGLYGSLRQRFDSIYVRLKRFAASVKRKMRRLSRSRASSFGSWVKAAAQVIFKIFKLVGAWAIRETVDKLVDSFQDGVSKNIKKLVDMATPEGVKSKIEEFEEAKDRYRKIIDATQASLEEKFLGPHLALFKKLSVFEEQAAKVSKIVTLVEWGVRLLACASPPAIGCLWNLAISALQAAFARLIQTCWFTKKAAAPVISRIELVRNFPAKMAGELVTAANDQIPVPRGFDPLFAPITQRVSSFNVDCDAGRDGGAGLTPEREAILDLLDEIGEEKFRALLELMAKRGAGPWVLLTPERIRALGDPLKAIKLETLKELAEDRSKGAPTTSLEEFLADISKYTPREKRVAKVFFEEKAKREAAKLKRGEGGRKAPDGTGGKKRAGEKPGTDGGLTVLEGKDHTIRGEVEHTGSAPGIYAVVHDPSLDHGRKSPAVITVDVYVGGVLTYRVKDVRVRSTFGAAVLARQGMVELIVYYLRDGLHLRIGGMDIYWEQLNWSRLRAD